MDDDVFTCIACNSTDVDEESYGIRCYACGYVHPFEDNTTSTPGGPDIMSRPTGFSSVPADEE